MHSNSTVTMEKLKGICRNTFSLMKCDGIVEVFIICTETSAVTQNRPQKSILRIKMYKSDHCKRLRRVLATSVFEVLKCDELFFYQGILDSRLHYVFMKNLLIVYTEQQIYLGYKISPNLL